ncbi:MAG TPA: formyltransferase [Candidatus Binatia bacterium]|jgi:methionyl-tRNA formyltransferase
MKLAVFAYQDIGFECLDFLIETGEQIVAVVTHEDDPKEEIWFRSVAELGRAHCVPVYMPRNPNTPDFIEVIRKAAPEIIFSFYYRQLLCNDLLAIPRHGAMNLHGSLLPRYRGRAPVNWALVNGESETGVTLHYMVERADAGDIVAQRRVAIDHADTALTLYRKLTRAARGLLNETYPAIKTGTAPRIPQDARLATKFGGRRPEDGKIDWDQPATAIYNLVRAVTHPYPGAFTFFRGGKLFLWRASVAAPDSAGARVAPGTIVSRAAGEGVEIAAGAGRLALERLQLEGEEELPANIFAARHQIQVGERLG